MQPIMLHPLAPGLYIMQPNLRTCGTHRREGRFLLWRIDRHTSNDRSSPFLTSRVRPKILRDFAKLISTDWPITNCLSRYYQNSIKNVATSESESVNTIFASNIRSVQMSGTPKDPPHRHTTECVSAYFINDSLQWTTVEKWRRIL